MKTPSHHEGRAVADRLIDEVKGNSPAAVNFGFALRLPGQEVATALAQPIR